MLDMAEKPLKLAQGKSRAILIPMKRLLSD